MNQNQKVNFIMVLAALTTIVLIYLVYQFNKFKELEAARWNVIFTFNKETNSDFAKYLQG